MALSRYRQGVTFLDDLAEAREAARGLTPIFAPSHQTIGTPAGW